MAEIVSPTNKASATCTAPTTGTTPERLTRKNIEAFHSDVWPVLLQQGWNKIDSTESLDGKTIFVAPVLALKVGVKGEDFYEDPRDVLARLLERRNANESRAADVYLACVGGPPSSTSEKEGDTSKAISHTNVSGKMSSTDAAVTQEEDTHPQTTEQGLHHPEPMDIDESPADPEGSEPNTLQQEHPDPKKESSDTTAKNVAVNEMSHKDNGTKAKTEAIVQLAASYGKETPEKDVVMDTAETGVESGKVTQLEDQDMAEPKTKDESDQPERDKTIESKTDVKENDASSSVVKSVPLEKDLGAQTTETPVTQAILSKKELSVVTEEDIKTTNYPDREKDEGGDGDTKESSRSTHGEVSDLENDTDNKSETSASVNQGKTPKDEPTEKIVVGKRRRRAASKMKESDMYKEDELEDIIEAHESAGMGDESELHSIDEGSNDGKDVDGSENESNEEDQRPKRRKRKAATKEAKGEIQPKKRGRGRPKRKTKDQASPKRAKSPQPRGRKPRQPSVAMIDLSWKNGGKNFPKKISQVGPDFNATEIPEKGTWKENDSSVYCEQIWDPAVAEEKLQAESTDFLLKKNVPHNKREAAMIGLAQVDYDANKFDKEGIIGKITTHDGSEWTVEERTKYHHEIFRLRKDIRAVSKSTGKSMNSCLAYYLGTYKKTIDYRLMKTVHFQERMHRMLEADHDIDACGICGDGGNLLICDACEGEFHMECMRPALESIPEGRWECDECVDRAFLAAKDSLLRNSNLFERIKTAVGDGKKADEQSSKDKSTSTESVSMRLKPLPHIQDVVRKLANNIGKAFSEEVDMGVEVEDDKSA